MAMQWAPGVRVNCVCPGMIETPMTRALLDDPAFREAILLKYPLQRFGQPDEVPSAILYLASDEARFVTGVALPVDGGYTPGRGGDEAARVSDLRLLSAVVPHADWAS